MAKRRTELERLSFELNMVFPTEEEDTGTVRREGGYVIGSYVGWIIPPNLSGNIRHSVRTDIPYVGCTVKTPEGRKYMEVKLGLYKIDPDGKVVYLDHTSPDNHKFTNAALIDGIRLLNDKIISMSKQFSLMNGE